MPKGPHIQATMMAAIVSRKYAGRGRGAVVSRGCMSTNYGIYQAQDLRDPESTRFCRVSRSHESNDVDEAGSAAKA